MLISYSVYLPKIIIKIGWQETSYCNNKHAYFFLAHPVGLAWLHTIQCKPNSNKSTTTTSIKITHPSPKRLECQLLVFYEQFVNFLYYTVLQYLYASATYFVLMTSAYSQYSSDVARYLSSGRLKPQPPSLFPSPPLSFPPSPFLLLEVDPLNPARRFEGAL